MSRLGTCKHSHQIQEMWLIPLSPDYSHPHTGSNAEHVTAPEEYTCQWLDGAGDLPPPIKRQHGGFSLRPTDCDNCTRFEAACTVVIT